jgi:hypothetical protein
LPAVHGGIEAMFVGSASSGHKWQSAFYHLPLSLFDVESFPRLNGSKRPSIVMPLKDPSLLPQSE